MRRRVGVWLFGARGSVATTTIAGAAALAHGAPPAGVVTELPDFARAGLVPLDHLVFGGHDVCETPLTKQVERLVAGGVLPAGLDALIGAELAEAERNLVVLPAADTQYEVVRRIAEDIKAFRLRNDLDQVVAINVASTEAPYGEHPAHAELALLREALAEEDVLPPSSLNALAAFEALQDLRPGLGLRPLPEVLLDVGDFQRALLERICANKVAAGHGSRILLFSYLGIHSLFMGPFDLGIGTLTWAIGTFHWNTED